MDEDGYMGEALTTAPAGEVEDVPTGLPTLRLMSRGEAVKVLQSALNAEGHSPVVVDGPFVDVVNTLVVDGIFGRGTLEAVKSFQRASGLSADGIVGPKTWAALVAG